jgi:SAM-dependent methyltransferase
MGHWYSHHIYPRLMDQFLNKEGPLRREALKTAHGCVLEVGFGTGLNLRYYPATVDKLVTLDVAKMLPVRVERRISAASFRVQQVIIEPNAPFPFREDQFDCVVTTWTLCSVPATGRLLGEIQRVLRPDGAYLFLEHGRAFDERAAHRQRRLNWASRLLANGCRLNTRIPDVIKESGFNITELNEFINDHAISVAGYMYQGIAKKNVVTDQNNQIYSHA